VQLDSSSLDALSAFVLKMTPRNDEALRATIYQANHCSACHQVNGAGTKVGPLRPASPPKVRDCESLIWKEYLPASADGSPAATTRIRGDLATLILLLHEAVKQPSGVFAFIEY